MTKTRSVHHSQQGVFSNIWETQLTPCFAVKRNFWKKNWKCCRIYLQKKCFNKYYYVGLLIYNVYKKFHFIKIFRENNQTCVRQKSSIFTIVDFIRRGWFLQKWKSCGERSGTPQWNWNSKPLWKRVQVYCLNCECYYPVDEHIVSCTCSWCYGGQRREEDRWWD